ncbi:MAG: flavodoxin family protein [Verrucomicrobiota bacterium]
MTTSRIAIVYFSHTGHNQLMAEAIAEGAREDADTQADLLRITGEQITAGRWRDDAMAATLQEAHAIVFGSPTYMGSAAAQFKAFADWSSEVWMQQGWADKLAGGFTHAAGLSGDKLNTLVYFSILAAQHGMTWINPADHGYFEPQGNVRTNRMGSYLGVMGQSDLDPNAKEAALDASDRESCRLFGLRLAKWTHRVFSTPPA